MYLNCRWIRNHEFVQVVNIGHFDISMWNLKYAFTSYLKKAHRHRIKKLNKCKT